MEKRGLPGGSPSFPYGLDNPLRRGLLDQIAFYDFLQLLPVGFFPVPIGLPGSGRRLPDFDQKRRDVVL